MNNVNWVGRWRLMCSIEMGLGVACLWLSGALTPSVGAVVLGVGGTFSLLFALDAHREYLKAERANAEA